MSSDSLIYVFFLHCHKKVELFYSLKNETTNKIPKEKSDTI